jgi:hypothetical protein
LGKVVKLESKPRRAPKLCTRLQSRTARARVREESPLTPEMKAFIDAAIVPVLVKKYLALEDREDELAERDPDTAHSVSSTAAPGLGEVRP